MGMDIIGPFRKRADQVPPSWSRLLYKMDRGRATRIHIGEERSKYVWRSIVCRFGVPNTIITNNERQFIYRGLQCFYDDLEVKSITVLVDHPQTNGQAEAANKVILNKLKKCVGKAKGRWTEELIEVLWAYRCTPDNHTGNAITLDIQNRGNDFGRSGRAHHMKTNVRPHPKRGKPIGQPRLGKRTS